MKKYWKITLTVDKLTTKELAALKRLLKEHCKADTEGGVVAFDQPSPTCPPDQNC